MLKYVKPLHYSKVKAVCSKNTYSEKSALFQLYHSISILKVIFFSLIFGLFALCFFFGKIST